MRKKTRIENHESQEAEPMILQDAAVPFNASTFIDQTTALPDRVSVRTAKASLSALLDLVAKGGQILITSDGRPKARLVPVDAPKPRKVFEGSADHLQTMPAWAGGMDSTELISADRDGR